MTPKGMKHKPETIAKISASQKARWAKLEGDARKHSPTHVAAMSAAMKGRKAWNARSSTAQAQKAGQR